MIIQLHIKTKDHGEFYSDIFHAPDEFFFLLPGKTKPHFGSPAKMEALYPKEGLIIQTGGSLQATVYFPPEVLRTSVITVIPKER